MRPLVSLVLSVKNGMPHVKMTLDAVRRQTYSNYELVVQDGGSTDGTLEYVLSRTDLRGLSVRSEPDTGVGQGYNRALARSTGRLVCFIASDEYLEDDALERGVAWYERCPDAVFINGSVRLINAGDEPIGVFDSPHFDLVSHLKCETVLAFAGLLDREKIGSDCFLDESLKTCPDYDFWIRVGSRFAPSCFVVVREVFKTARADRASMSFRTESFDQFCDDKTHALNRFLDAQPPGPVIEALRPLARAGILLWAAESLLSLAGPSAAFLAKCQEAAKIAPWSPRLFRLSARSHAFTVDQTTGRLIPVRPRQPGTPPGATMTEPGGLDLRSTVSLPQWAGARVESGHPIVVRTPAKAWAYAAQIPMSGALAVDVASWYWARIELEVLSGQVAVGVLSGREMGDEHVVQAQGRTTVFLRIAGGGGVIMIRTGAQSEASVVQLFSASVERCVKPEVDR